MKTRPSRVFLFILTTVTAQLALLTSHLAAEIKTEETVYKFDGVKLRGYTAWDDSQKGKRPGVLVVHEWWGLNDYARSRARQLAELGYVAFAVDMYGEGKATDHPEDAGKMSAAVQKDEKLLLGRARAGLAALKLRPEVDPERVGAIGYCFGGAVVLKLAFSGEELNAVASFHGSLPLPADASKIKSRILICHGADDSFISEATIAKLKSTLDRAKVNYTFESYPGAVHGFTVPDADKRGMKGVAYNKDADQKSWAAMKKLFADVF